MSGRVRIAILAVGLSAAPVAGASAGVVVQGRVFDGEASSRAILQRFQEKRGTSEDMKVPWSEKDVTLALVQTGASGATAGGEIQRWNVRTGSGGELTVDTGLASLPEASYLVAISEGPGHEPRYSPFFRPSAGGSLAVHLYPLTESSTDLLGRLSVVYDIFGADNMEKKDAKKEERSIRIRVGLTIWNRGERMYIGSRRGSPWREVWRIPFPRGGKLIQNRGPDEGTPGWTVSEDGRWLVIDSPVPGLSDLDRMSTWEAHFLVPAAQTFIQTYPIAFTLEPAQLTAWCVHDDMALRAPGFHEADTRAYPDPLTGAPTPRFDVIGAKRAFRDGESAALVLTVDNAAIGQISRRAVKWVGGFILLIAVSALIGLALGRKTPAPDVLFSNLSGEEILDRIVQLDRLHEEKKIDDREYQRHREALVALAAEELGEEAVPAARGRDPAAGGPVLPPAARDILQRIDELERNGGSDPARIAERAHLLEALAKVLRRESPRG